MLPVSCGNGLESIRCFSQNSLIWRLWNTQASLREVAAAVSDSKGTWISWPHHLAPCWCFSGMLSFIFVPNLDKFVNYSLFGASFSRLDFRTSSSSSPTNVRATKSERQKLEHWKHRIFISSAASWWFLGKGRAPVLVLALLEALLWEIQSFESFFSPSQNGRFWDFHKIFHCPAAISFSLTQSFFLYFDFSSFA